jgi:rfaE bifunctional protein kinase chain/domain
MVIGDIMLDKWTYHRQTRFSPEAAVPIIKETSSSFEIGGAGNALRHLDALTGHRNKLITVTGNDQNARKLLEIVQSANYLVNAEIVESRTTTLKERFFLDSQPVFRVDVEEAEDIPLKTQASILRTIEKEIYNYDVILLSDYAKGVLTRSLVNDIVSLSKAQNIPIVTDPGFGRLDIYKGCTAIKPNSIEWDEYVRSMGNENKGIEQVFEHGTKYLLITQGADGVRLITPETDVLVKPDQSVRVVDVTGAGDSVAAAITLLVGSGNSISENLNWLNEIGSRTVQNPKTQL